MSNSASNIFEIDFIRSSRSYKRNKDGKVVYRVHWLGYSTEDETWEPICNMFVDTHNKELYRVIKSYKKTAQRNPHHKRLCLNCIERVHSGNIFCEHIDCIAVKNAVFIKKKEETPRLIKNS
jgi:myo-inositol catabolism protein IolC